MPRPRHLPLDDALLDLDEAAALCKVSPSRWKAYAARFPRLVRACRKVQVNPQGPGVDRWLKSALIEHMHLDLACSPGRPGAPVPTAGKRSGDLTGFMSQREGSDSPARYHSPARDVSGHSSAPLRTTTACPGRGLHAEAS